MNSPEFRASAARAVATLSVVLKQSTEAAENVAVSMRASEQFKALVKNDALLVALRESGAQVARLANVQLPKLDVTPLVVASEAASKAAPDLVRSSAVGEFVGAVVSDYEAFPDEALSAEDQRLEQALRANLTADREQNQQVEVGQAPAAVRAGQWLLFTLLSVGIDRAVPDREQLAHLVIVLVHVLRNLPG